MPYFVYKIIPPFKQLEQLQNFETFKDASSYAKTQRAAMQSGDKFTVKVVFADDAFKAEMLLTEEREPEPVVGEDY
ncbi:MAG: hypothetical protein KGZ83_08200 [Sulfuricella sp.]|nr:hypothetical protein [Sulfuricella sp.]